MERLIVPVEEQIPQIDARDLPSHDHIKNGLIAKVDAGRDLSFGSLVESDGGIFRYVTDKFKYDGELINWCKGLRDKVVVDLGAGGGVAGYEFARIAGARGYVGVEPFFAQKLLRELDKYIKREPEEFNDKKHIPVSVVCEDMLKTLRRIPSNSVSLISGVIDEFVMEDCDNYIIEVGNEINWVLHPFGSYINYGSIFYPRNLNVEEISEEKLTKFFK